MTTGLFCHYLPIYKDVNGIYCSTTLTDDLFRRYFCVVDKLIVATRVYKLNMSFEEAHQERITLRNIKIVEFPNLSTPKNLITKYSHTKAVLAKLIKQSDLIFIRGGIIALMGARIARSYNKPYLFECAGCAWDEYWNYSLSGKLLAPLMEYSTKKAVKNASHVVYVTEKWLQNRYPTRGISTYASNVILDEIDENALAMRKKRIKNNDSKKTIVIGTTGGIGNKAKGQQYVIEAMKSLSHKYDIRYELVGGGDSAYLEYVAKRYGQDKRVVFKGQLTHDEVLNWLDSIDLYIQPSMQEGLPRSLIEAMSRACPAVGSTTAGIPELLNKDNVFVRGSVKSLISVINHTLKQDLSIQACRNFEKSKEFQIDVLNSRREKLYKNYRDYVLR